MSIRYRVAALAATLCLVVASNALAARPAPTPQGTIAPGAPVMKINPEAATTACVLGVTGAPVAPVGYILPPDDSYYTLLKASDCPECHGEPRLYTFAHVGLYFQTHCQQVVTVSIVGSTGGVCPRPSDVVLCPPRTYLIDSAAMGIPLGVAVDITLPLTAGCCLQGDVFLKVEYDQGSCNVNSLGFLTEAPGCSGCTQYNIWPGGADDLCTAVLGPNGYGLFLMSAEAECCGGTPADKKSWGEVKGMYR